MVYTGVDMSLTCKLDSDQSSALVLVAQNYPEVEEKLHNFEQPDQCRCFPDIYLYMGEDDTPDFSVVEHKWVQ